MSETQSSLLLQECEKRIQEGSKSFSFASRVFSTRERRGAFLLYAWCRYADDAIDRLDESESLRAQLPQALRELKEQTRAAFEGKPGSEAAFRAIAEVARRRGVPEFYASELLEGMAMDVSRYQYHSVEQLLLYCYRVAGTVGLMMTHIMGASDERALEHAGSLGIAMQLTNIARDVHEDATLGRVYIPSEWMNELRMNSDAMAILAAKDEQIMLLRKRLLGLAEQYYARGLDGTRFLSFRSSLTIRVAAFIYREIGRKILRQSPGQWRTRTIVSAGQKIWLLILGILSGLKELPERLRVPHRDQPIKTIWRLS